MLNGDRFAMSGSDTMAMGRFWACLSVEFSVKCSNRMGT